MSIRATLETCSVLLWFCQRFHLEIPPYDRDVLERRAAAYKANCESFSQVLAGEIHPRPIDLAIPLRGYQAIDVELALRTGGLLVASDVGTGKTAIGIGAATIQDARPALIVTLTHLPQQWIREFGRFAPDLTVHQIKRGTPYDVTDPMALSTSKKKNDPDRLRQLDLISRPFPDVLVTNYHKLDGWAEELASKVKLVVFDEADELRHMDSNKYRAAKIIADACRYRIALSARPIFNFGAEFFGVVSVIRPGVLGTQGEFLEEWCTGYADPEKGNIKDPKAFGSYLRDMGIMVRRTRADIGRELPPLSRSVIYVDTDEKALRSIEGPAVELAKILLSETTLWSDRGQAARDLDWRLRQATGLSKAPHVAAFVNILVESGRNVVLYGWHHSVYAVWMERLKEHHPVLFTGRESPTQKQAAFEFFLSGKSKVLIMSLRAGRGVDGLQGCCRDIVFGEMDWSPAVHHQAIGRIHRDGQDSETFAHFLVCNDGSDPIMMEVCGIKDDQSIGVLDPDAEIFEPAQNKDAMKRLAADFLRQRGIALPVPTPEEAAGRETVRSEEESPCPTS